MIELRNDRLIRNQPFTAAAMKPLNDSCYVVPEKNPRVLQESTPVRDNAFKIALQRHEQEVSKQKNFNEIVVKNHFDKIRNDQEEHERKNQERREKQRKFQETIQNQMQDNAETRTHARNEDRSFAKTSFGPEETEEDLRHMFEKERSKKLGVKNDLSAQIESKKVTDHMDKNTRLNEEQEMIRKNVEDIQGWKNKRQRERDDFKSFTASMVASN
jgi:hypothetical protein